MNWNYEDTIHRNSQIARYLGQKMNKIQILRPPLMGPQCCQLTCCCSADWSFDFTSSSSWRAFCEDTDLSTLEVAIGRLQFVGDAKPCKSKTVAGLEHN